MYRVMRVCSSCSAGADRYPEGGAEVNRGKVLVHESARLAPSRSGFLLDLMTCRYVPGDTESWRRFFTSPRLFSDKRGGGR